MCGWIRRVATAVQREGRSRTAETYLSAGRSFGRFLAAERGAEDVRLTAVDAALVGGYQAWLMRRGLQPGTVSFYLRLLRAAYNRAVRDALVRDARPFERAYTARPSTRKRALDLTELQRLARLDLRQRPRLAYARDMFFLSLALRGMSFVDMALLRADQLRGGRVVYQRRKTGQVLSLRWEEAMERLTEPYPRAEGLLLPLVGPDDLRRGLRLESIAKRLGRWLRRLGVEAGLREPLTMYVARHSWATLARRLGVPIGIIGEGLGHTNERTTLVYLAQIESDAVDVANAQVLAALAKLPAGDARLPRRAPLTGPCPTTFAPGAAPSNPDELRPPHLF